MAKKNKVSYLEILKDGIITKNPTFIQLLGMCPTLAVTTTVANGIGMGLSATFVLICSNFFISVLRKFIPNKIRIASYIVIIAGFVSTVEMIINAWLPELSKSLGLFIPLIVVNCIILARAEAFASKNSPLPSAVDGLASGIGFTLALTIISAIRELLGNGTILGANIMGENFSPALIIILPAGGFLVLGFLIALVQYIMSKLEGRSK
ncbi:MAG: electron transport complex subunit E [Clostridia bacterium]|nr:electron transport complex subunit E [Clostridia bacterium]MBO5298752.1 electron transport complex subunit E [Clostridia bacterium]MBQ4628622.1 electron transport complex subunit E [Clostridia bacterium]